MHPTRDGGAAEGPTADTRVHIHVEASGSQGSREVIANSIAAGAANGCRLTAGDLLEVGVRTLGAEHRCWRGRRHRGWRPLQHPAQREDCHQRQEPNYAGYPSLANLCAHASTAHTVIGSWPG